MTNEQILNNRWKNIDKYLKEYSKKYKNINQTTLDKIQNVFNAIDIPYSDVNKPISKEQKKRLNRFILDLKKKGLLTNYFGYKARLIYNKKSVTYLEMIEIMIMGCYIEQNEILKDDNNLLFFNTCKDSYDQAIGDIVKIKDIKPISFKVPILYTLLNIPILNATAEAYLYSLALTNAEELYKQILINMQLGKRLDVDSKYYKELFNKQNNRFININGEKLSGGIVNIVENLSNLAYLQAGIDTDTKECRFIAEMDKRTTKMCQTLNNKIFKLDEMNVYKRYSDQDKTLITYQTMGLVQGENLPPINNHFHYCRSTISYNLDPNVADYVRGNIKSVSDYDIEQYKNTTKYWISKSLVNRNAKVIIPNKEEVYNYKGEEYIIDGKNVVVEYSNDEKIIAEWLSKKINKKITMVPRINYPFGIKTPDYQIKNMYFDLKSINGVSNQALYHSIRGKEMQSDNFIFDITNSKLNLSDVYVQVNTIYIKKDTKWVNIIMIKKEDNLVVFERQ